MYTTASFESVLAGYECILMEAAISELLEHRSPVEVHPELGCAPCIYDPGGQQALKNAYQANASSLEHHALDQAEKMEADPLDDWGDRMLELHRRWGLKILGGCCGTGEEHLRYLVGPAPGGR